MISKELKVAVLLNEKKAYQIAQEAGIHPSTLSKILHGIEKVEPGDERILRVAKVSNLDPRECFTKGIGGSWS
jgi:transcriptional regulator with XRE-family HTH domain